MSAAETQGDFVISRVFDAPRDLVWKAFTEPERMKEWWGPKGFTVIASKMDFRPGGTYHYGMKAPDGSAMWGKFVYREIVPPERMVFINSFSDEAGGITRHPMHLAWPLVAVNRTDLMPLTLGLGKFQGEYYTIWNELMAVAFVSTLPSLTIFLLFQRYFVKGIVLSGIKG